MKQTKIIAVAGGSGSGKTTLAQKIHRALGEDFSTLISQDNYYRDQSHLFDGDGGAVNFDHPDSLDFDLMASQLRELSLGKMIDCPKYCFKTHGRLNETTKINPAPIIILDGILILHSDSVREAVDYSIFLDVPEEHRFERRINRDVVERGRTRDGSLKQIETHVKPMHDLFVDPSKKWASEVLVHPTLEILDNFAQNLSNQFR